MKKFGTFIGLALGLAAVFGTFFMEGGSFQALFNIPALTIVFGGTFAAVIMGFGLDKFVLVPQLMKMAYFPKTYDIAKIISTFVELSIKSRKEGLLSIERDLKKFDDMFPRKMTKFVLDGTDAESLQLLAQLETKAMQERHFSNINIFVKMGGYAPTMGIIGTVISLIMTLANAGASPDLLIKNIAVAFLATLWGIFTANLIWLPIGDRLKRCHSEEKNMMELSLEAVLTLQSGEIPSIMKARLIGMLPQKEQQEKLAA
ncbi:MAG: MotA/TolQ/ExbB proton channel family protein [Bacteroidota bacterium]